MTSPEKGIFSKSLLANYSTYTFNKPAGKAIFMTKAGKLFRPITPFCICLLLCVTRVYSQSNVIDTFETSLNKEKNDSIRLSRAATLSKYFQNIDSATSWKYYRIAKQIADKRNTPISKITILELEGVLNTSPHPVQAYALYQQAIELCRQQDTSKTLKLYEASLSNNLGVISYLNADYEGAIYAFNESVKIYEAINASNGNLPVTLNNIATVYGELNYPARALEYSRETAKYASLQKDPRIKATSYIGLSGSYLSMKKYDSAYKAIWEAYHLTQASHNQYDLFLCYTNMGNYFDQLDKADSALYYFRKSVPLAKTLNSPFDVASAISRVVNIVIGQGDFVASKRMLDSIEDIIKKYDFRLLRRNLFNLSGEYYKRKGDAAKGFEFLRKYEALNDSIFNENRLKRIDFLEERYQSEKKMAAITRLENEKKIQDLSIKQKSTMNYILLGSLLVLLIIGSLVYAYNRKKQQLSKQTEQLQAQRIKELEQEKQLIAFDSLLKGQEEERSRLAKDLHDGLGGMLSGVKLSLSAMKGNIILTEDNARLFTKALDQLDNSIGEMRRVAHNMMPEALVKFGLQQAVQDYCDGLTESQHMKIKCQFHGLENRMEAATEIIIYRIIQELLNNIVKHAQASEALVQVMRHDGSVAITVEDNGKGFEPAKLEFQKGAGLSNVRSRVDYLKGQMDIRSELGKGTSIHIECSLTEA